MKLCILRKLGFPDLITYFEEPMRMHYNTFLCYRHGFPGENIKVKLLEVRV